MCGFDLEEVELPLVELELVWCGTSGTGGGLINVAGFGGMGFTTVAATSWFPSDEFSSGVIS